MNKKLLIPLTIVLAIIIGFVLYRDSYIKPSPNTTSEPAKIISAEFQKNLGKPKPAVKQTSYGDLKGEEITGQITSNEAMIPHFENDEELKKEGFLQDNNLSADGPGSSVWGYKKTDGSRSQVVIFSYETVPSSNNPNEPLQFDCPCTVNVSVFISHPFGDNNTSLANPASENCTKVGGTLTIMKRGDGGEFGLCNFEDDQACEEWALMRGECPVGGVKTTGYDTEDQMYCAWLGGQTLAVANSQCTLPDGTTCSTIDLYNGKCNE